jgi:hemoglobin
MMTDQFGVEDASYQAVGKEPGVRALVKDFYRIMGENPKYARLRAMHKNDIDVSEDKLASFLCGWLGGPRLYREKYGPISIPQVHQPLSVTEKEMNQWLDCMSEAIKQQNFSQTFSTYLMTQLKVPANRIVQAGKKT